MPHEDRNKPFLGPQASSRLQLMAEAAMLAGDHLAQLARDKSQLNIEQKSLGDFVSEADRAAEQMIATHLNQTYPQYGWLGEETGMRASEQDGLCWIVDPLDGTTNFLKELPHWAISIALYKGPDPLCAIIYDPVKSEMFSAERAGGCYLNGQSVQVNTNSSFETALLGTGVPSGARSAYLSHCLTDLQTLMPLTAGIRRGGAAALDLAYVACGRLDAYWERNLGAWDIAAGMLLVKEAGGYVAPLWPDKDILMSGSFVAGPKGLVNALLAKLDRRQISAKSV